MELADFQISLLLTHSFSRSFEDGENHASNAVNTKGMCAPTLGALVALLDTELKKPDSELAVTSLVTDSRRVVPGALFFAISGLRTNGNLYIEEAIDRGAVAIVTAEDLGSHLPIPAVQVGDVRIALAQIARVFYEAPDASLALTGVTGTNGKTTVTMLLQHLIGGEETVGLLGTVRYDLGKRTLPSFKTTPESVDIYAMLSQVKQAGVTEVSMEVSSHGIDQQRVYGLHFDVAVFMNLTQDHIDYHENMESYFATKKRLFSGEIGAVPRVSVVNLDCPYGERLLASLNPSQKSISFGIEKEATFQASALKFFKDHTEFKLTHPEGEVSVSSPLIGRYNISNLLGAIAAGYARGYSIQSMMERLLSFRGVPGRMERVEISEDLSVLVDYAHTDDALRNATSMLSDLTQRNRIVVFGCGGDRDRSKRAPMLRAVLEHAEIVIATADNPRSESLEQIFADMRSGIEPADLQKVQFIKDRKRAISIALDSAQAGDALLVAGKGHETFQEFGDSVIPFDDRQVIRDLWKLKKEGSV